MILSYNRVMVMSMMNRIALCLPIIFLALLLPETAAANSVSTVLCKAGGYIWGPVGSTIAILGVISLGLMAMFGRIQISNVLVVMVGISIIFGTRGVMQALGLNEVATACAGSVGAGATGTKFYQVLACLTSWFTGPVGKALGTLAVMTVGLFATFGRMSWHQALIIGLGIAMMFGAVTIVSSLGGGSRLVGLTLPVGCGTGVFSTEVIFCNLLSWFRGSVGKSIATLGLVIFGIGALMGKTSWGMAIVVTIGVALTFGATSVVTAIGGGNATYCYAMDIATNMALDTTSVRPTVNVPPPPTPSIPSTPNGTPPPVVSNGSNPSDPRCLDAVFKFAHASICGS